VVHRPKHIPDVLRQDPRKTPKGLPQPDWWSRNPAWRIGRLEMRDPFGWHQLDEATLHDVRGKLAHFEKMTLNEIFGVARDRNHPVPVGKLCSAARSRLSELRLVVDQVYSLRLSGEQRVWAILIENVLHLLWWDPEHSVCPSHKKHT